MLTGYQHCVELRSDTGCDADRPDRARVLPRGWNDLIRQILLGVAAYMLYEVVRAVVDGSAFAPGYKPFGDATKIINLERLLHVFVEPSIQAWAPNSAG